MGLLAAALERLPAALPRLHRVEGQGARHLQDHRPAPPRRPLGQAEEPPQHELRQDVASPALLLQGAHPAEGARGETLLQVGAAIFNFISLSGWVIYTGCNICLFFYSSISLIFHQ